MAHLVVSCPQKGLDFVGRRLCIPLSFARLCALCPTTYYFELFPFGTAPTRSGFCHYYFEKDNIDEEKKTVPPDFQTEVWGHAFVTQTNPSFLTVRVGLLSSMSSSVPRQLNTSDLLLFGCYSPSLERQCQLLSLAAHPITALHLFWIHRSPFLHPHDLPHQFRTITATTTAVERESKTLAEEEWTTTRRRSWSSFFEPEFVFLLRFRRAHVRVFRSHST